MDGVVRETGSDLHRKDACFFQRDQWPVLRGCFLCSKTNMTPVFLACLYASNSSPELNENTVHLHLNLYAVHFFHM